MAVCSIRADSSWRARWLIEESAPELYSELTARSDEQPSPLELARLISAVNSEWEIPEAMDAAYWLIAQSELASAHLARLEQVAYSVTNSPVSAGRIRLCPR